jgi:regulation of enolase protein 1 (concanavalin A-like superfamily)
LSHSTYAARNPHPLPFRQQTDTPSQSSHESQRTLRQYASFYCFLFKLSMDQLNVTSIEKFVSKATSVYVLIFTFVFTLNIIALGLVAGYKMPWQTVTFTYGRIPILVSGNFFIGVLVRNEHVVNTLFHIMLTVPTHWPLRLRCYCAKIYHYGGIHSGCNSAASLWYIFFAVMTLMTNVSVRNTRFSSLWIVSLILTIIILTFLSIIISFTLPRLRHQWHDSFESIHRFGGWLILTLFWVQIFIAAKIVSQATRISYQRTLLTSPTLWIHAATTMLIIYPWLHVRQIKVSTECLSNHVVKVNFPGLHGQAGTAIRVAKGVLTDYHAFAVIPNDNNATGFSILVSNAGDWTSDLIKNPRPSLWIRRITAYGVVSVVSMFSPVVVVATGSGIGPCLAMFTALTNHSFRIVWSTRTPVATYGNTIVDAVKRADPNATIVNTDESGRQDMVVLAETKFRETNAEAIIIISKPNTVKRVVRVMEKRGIPCFGPIFDS